MEPWSNKLKVSGLKITPQRLLIIKVLDELGDESHPGAEDIWKTVFNREPNISRATVYRNLKQLVDSGIINELYFRDGKARFELNKEHHHHFVCLICGGTEKIAADGLEQVYREVGQSRKVVSHQFEVFGYCDHCERKGGKA